MMETEEDQEWLIDDHVKDTVKEEYIKQHVYPLYEPV